MEMRQSVLAICACLLGGAPAAMAQETDIWSGLFSEEQVARGAALYASNCAECHGSELVPSDPDIATLTAPAFRWSWQMRTLAERYQRISTTMPPARPGDLDDQEYVDIIAFILAFNGYPAGAQDLVPDTARFEQITLSLEP